jgi:hypothetical protein
VKRRGRGRGPAGDGLPPTAAPGGAARPGTGGPGPGPAASDQLVAIFVRLGRAGVGGFVDGIDDQGVWLVRSRPAGRWRVAPARSAGRGRPAPSRLPSRGLPPARRRASSGRPPDGGLFAPTQGRARASRRGLWRPWSAQPSGARTRPPGPARAADGAVWDGAANRYWLSPCSTACSSRGRAVPRRQTRRLRGRRGGTALKPPELRAPPPRSRRARRRRAPQPSPTRSRLQKAPGSGFGPARAEARRADRRSSPDRA